MSIDPLICLWIPRSVGWSALLGPVKSDRENGADDNLANRHGVTPVALATSISNFDVIQHFKGSRIP